MSGTLLAYFCVVALSDTEAASILQDHGYAIRDDVYRYGLPCIGSYRFDAWAPDGSFGVLEIDDTTRQVTWYSGADLVCSENGYCTLKY